MIVMYLYINVFFPPLYLPSLSSLSLSPLSLPLLSPLSFFLLSCLVSLYLSVSALFHLPSCLASIGFELCDCHYALFAFSTQLEFFISCTFFGPRFGYVISEASDQQCRQISSEFSVSYGP